jgi:hypothetical protein
MLVTYLVHGEPGSLETREEEDLRQLLAEIRHGLHDRHPELADDQRLLLLVTDELLNGLADGRDEIVLGELAAP